MSLLTDFMSEQYDALDFVLLFVAVTTLSLIGDHYLGGYGVGEWWAILGFTMALFLLKQARSKKSNK